MITIPKIGQKVKYISHSTISGPRHNECGTIVDVIGNHTVDVKFDGSTNLSTRYPFWFCPFYVLELLDCPSNSDALDCQRREEHANRYL